MQASGYMPPPVRAPGSAAPSYWETMTYTVFEVAGVPLRIHGACDTRRRACVRGPAPKQPLCARCVRVTLR